MFKVLKTLNFFNSWCKSDCFLKFFDNLIEWNVRFNFCVQFKAKKEHVSKAPFCATLILFAHDF